MPKPTKEHSRYMAGLDGLRAVAVFAVIAYHLNFNWAPGGLLGVGVFFVLSGYLITDILITQWNRNGNLDLKDFWLRRAKRLLPALLSMLLLVVLWVTFFGRAHLLPLRGDIVPALFYISNWWLIFHNVSYFASFGPASPLGHLWSLAVEEQFYLLWPLLLLLGLRFIPTRRWLLVIIMLLAFASTCAMAVIYQPGSDPSRIYYGTDTRAFGLLIGAMLAFIWPSQKLTPTVTRPVKLLIDALGLIGLLIMIEMIHTSNEYNAFLYRGGLVILSAAAAMTVAALAHPASRLGRIFGWKPLRWLGVRSYGIYLWHYPVIVLTSPTIDTGGVNLTRSVYQIMISITLSVLSWRFIEEPIRQGALGRILAQARIRKWHLRARWMNSTIALLILCLSCVGFLTWPIKDATASSEHKVIRMNPVQSDTLVLMEPKTKQQTHTEAQTEPNDRPDSIITSIGSNENSKQSVMLSDQLNNQNKTNDTSNSIGNANQVLNQANPQTRNSDTVNSTIPGKDGSPATQSDTNSTTRSKTGQAITAIGDSVMIDIAPYLEKLIPGIVIDGKIGRQLYQAQDVVTELTSKKQIGDVVIIELGTNGSFTKSQLESLLRSLGDSKLIVLVNTRVPRPWESVVNATLANVAASFPNTKLVDWYQASANHDSYFYPDGVHLDPEGASIYASLVAKAVQNKITDS